jgi:toxin ParE1/3/4
MLLGVVFRREALADLESISDYISAHDPEAAARVIQRIHTSIYRTLATIPSAGRFNPETTAREYPVPGLPYLVIYLAGPTTLDIVAIFHTARSPDTKRRP